MGREQFDTPTQRLGCHNHKPKWKSDTPHKIQKKKTCQYCGNTRDVEKVSYKKRDNLNEKVKHLEGDMPTIHLPIDDFIFQVGNSRALLSHFT